MYTNTKLVSLKQTFEERSTNTPMQTSRHAHTLCNGFGSEDHPLQNGAWLKFNGGEKPSIKSALSAGNRMVMGSPGASSWRCGADGGDGDGSPEGLNDTHTPPPLSKQKPALQHDGIANCGTEMDSPTKDVARDNTTATTPMPAKKGDRRSAEDAADGIMQKLIQTKEIKAKEARARAAEKKRR